MEKYNIINLKDNSDYTSLVIICDTNSPFHYLPMIIKDLKNTNRKGRIILDQILHVGNTEKRFLCLDVDNGEKVEALFLPKNSLYRKLSCNFLRDHGLIEGSILSSIQKRMILKGISI